MDSVSQLVLGGAVGFAVAGKTAPRKALLWGAVMATLPDLDVLIQHPNALDEITKHRSWSHSWLMQTALAPIVALLMSRVVKVFDFKQWLLLIWSVWVTHSALDALTVFGTQLSWPFMPSPYSGGSIFIVDPLYTLPLLIGFVAVLWRPNNDSSFRLNRIGLWLSTAYLLWGLFVQQHVLSKATEQLQQQGIASDAIHVLATPLNTLLWRILVMQDDQYYEGFYSIADGEASMRFIAYPRHADIITALQPIPALSQLDWFTDGFFSAQKIGNSYVVTDLRMGLQPNYFFNFVIAQDDNDGVLPIVVQPFSQPQQRAALLSWVWRRIWSSDVKLDDDDLS